MAFAWSRLSCTAFFSMWMQRVELTTEVITAFISAGKTSQVDQYMKRVKALSQVCYTARDSYSMARFQDGMPSCTRRVSCNWIAVRSTTSSRAASKQRTSPEACGIVCRLVLLKKCDQAALLFFPIAQDVLAADRWLSVAISCGCSSYFGMNVEDCSGLS